MKIKTSELQDNQLNYAVAKAEGLDIDGLIGGAVWAWIKDDLTNKNESLEVFIPCMDWAQGGPIIEREIFKLFKNMGKGFTAQIKKRVPYYSPTYNTDIGMDDVISRAGPTPLIAAMRCYVASKLGDEVEVPDELF